MSHTIKQVVIWKCDVCGNETQPCEDNTCADGWMVFQAPGHSRDLDACVSCVRRIYALLHELGGGEARPAVEASVLAPQGDAAPKGRPSEFSKEWDVVKQLRKENADANG